MPNIVDTRIVLLFSLVSLALSFADTTTATQTLSAAICAIYDIVKNLLPIFGFVLFVLAGVVYAGGNFFGAETRAKAQGWAMNMIVGALIAFIISILGPVLLGAFGYTSACGVTFTP